MLTSLDQKRILARYKHAAGSFTLRQMSSDLGIQFSRLFRLFQGSEMKWHEYLMIKKKIEEHEGMEFADDNLRQVMDRFLMIAKQQDQEEIIQRMILINRSREFKN
jgi:hypothetical protein